LALDAISYLLMLIYEYKEKARVGTSRAFR